MNDDTDSTITRPDEAHKWQQHFEQKRKKVNGSEPANRVARFQSADRDRELALSAAPSWLTSTARPNVIGDYQPPRTFDQRGYFGRDIQRRYSLAQALFDSSFGSGLQGVEREVSQELSVKLGRKPMGVFIPDFAFLTRSDLLGGGGPSPSSGTAGQTFVPLSVEPSLIEVLRPNVCVMKAGATALPNLTGNVSIPRMTAANVATWAPENTLIARTSPTFDQVPITPSRLGIVTAYSKQLLAQSVLDVDNIIKDDMLKVTGVAIDNAALNGTGAGAMPLGVLNLAANTAGNYVITSRSPNQTFGGPATFNSYEQFISAVEDSNTTNDGTFAFLVSPKAKARAKVIPRAVNYPKYLWERVEGKDYLIDVPAFQTKLLDAPNTAVANQVLFGKFSDMIIAHWAGIDMVTDPYSLGDTFQIRVVIHVLVGIGFRHGLSFCASTDSGAQ